jgi:hypothetical protein
LYLDTVDGPLTVNQVLVKKNASLIVRDFDMAVSSGALQIELASDDLVVIDVLHDHHVHALRSAFLYIAIADAVYSKDLGKEGR